MTARVVLSLRTLEGHATHDAVFEAFMVCGYWWEPDAGMLVRLHGVKSVDTYETSREDGDISERLGLPASERVWVWDAEWVPHAGRA